MDLNEFYQEMNAHYFRANCFHTMRDPDNDATSGNHHVLNGTYYLIANKLGGNPGGKSFVAFVNSTETPDGWYGRHPNKMKDHESHDDNIGIIAGSKALKVVYNYGINIYNYGQKRRYLLKNYYNNLDTGFSLDNWHGRFPWLTALYKVSGGKKLNLWNKIGYCTYLLSDVYFNKNKQDTSGRILQWLANSVVKGESKMVDYCINKWEKNIQETYPGEMGEVLGIYHGFEHPFSKAMWRRM